MEENEQINNISFSVDAGLIDRLGKELVGRSETAVSELIKNSYDADATKVEITFVNTENIGGTLIISDNGLGMNIDELRKGFMTISSTDKIHNPNSLKFKRNKAGRKGIGRFATQGLGNKLIIISQTKLSDEAIKVTFDWASYKSDIELTSITNKIEYISKEKLEGTMLIIEGLREIWSETAIKRIYRYVSDLFQPDYLSENSKILNIANQLDNSFDLVFYLENSIAKKEIASPSKMLFEKNLATIEGHIDSEGVGFMAVKSNRLGLHDIEIKINKNKTQENFSFIKNVHFKVYYFIYNRSDYYTNITKLELSNIQKQARESSGVRLYRNGFRVLPYGEAKDDWLGLDIRYSGSSGVTNIPFGNNNLFGFVEILDKEGELFQETASREGLLNNFAFDELVTFLSKALDNARLRIAEKISLIRTDQMFLDSRQPSVDKEDHIHITVDPINALKNELDDLEILAFEFEKDSKTNDFKEKINSIKNKYSLVLEELSMLRILASLGLTIGEFTHEIIQYTPSINGYIKKLLEIESITPDNADLIIRLKKTFDNFTAYTSYFNTTVSENTSREIKPIDLNDVVNEFKKTIAFETGNTGFEVFSESYDYDLITVPMHVSEWNSILFNLYSNSKKAIKRENVTGKIKIIIGKEDERVYLEFHDNGDGIPEENKERVFNAFFTSLKHIDKNINDDRLTGNGLGLKIVKDIVMNYNGNIKVIDPEDSYNTCLRIEIPIATKYQKNNFGYE
ncbi:sensor histidine kinase [Flavobacterium aquidurense]|uniref:sensor histidine kinase n=1 Tax=Flavobacterium aquidurense TaxID=362413 RepID=UPI00091AFD04|nr:sensor histidine kinase [Flavobacterium aquidurense]SHG69269.1 histidine kinase [Flavobacterium frigidimaris]